MNLVGFIIRIYYDARSTEHEITEITVYKSMLEDVHNAHRQVVLNLDVPETTGAVGTRLKKIEPNVEERVICYEILSLWQPGIATQVVQSSSLLTCTHDDPPCIAVWTDPNHSNSFLCMISGFHRGVNQVFAIIGWKAVFIGSCLPTFRGSLSVQLSKLKLHFRRWYR